MNSLIARIHWLGLIFSLSLLIAVSWGWYSGSLDQLVIDDDLETLRTEHARLSAFDQKAIQLAQTAVLETDQKSLPHPWPTGWTVIADSDSAEPGESWELQSGDSPSWGSLLQAITFFTQIPANRIVKLEIRSRGTLSQREIASVTIQLVHPIETQSQRSNSVRTLFPANIVSAKTPKLGSGDTLRGDDLLRRPSPSSLLSSPTTGVSRPVVSTLNLDPEIL